MSKKKIHIILWCSEIRITYACKPNRRGRLYYFFCTKVEVNYRVGLATESSRPRGSKWIDIKSDWIYFVNLSAKVCRHFPSLGKSLII